MTKSKKIALCAGISLLAICAGACQGKEIFEKKLTKKEIVCVEDRVYSKAQAMLFLMTEKTIYSQSYGDEVWDKQVGDTDAENYVKEVVKNQLIQLNVMNEMAKDKGITLTDSEKQQVNTCAKEYYESLTKDDIGLMGIKQSDVQEMYTQYAIAKKLVGELTADVNTEVSDTAARVMEVQYIFRSKTKTDAEGNTTERTKKELKECKSTLKEVINAVKNEGKNFLTLAHKYSESSQVEMELNQSGMEEEFVSAAFALEDGQISEIVETDTGYYLVYCQEDYLEAKTEKNKENMQEDILKDAFMDEYNPFYEKQDILFNDEQWDKIKLADMDNLSVSSFYTVCEEGMSDDSES